MEYNMTEQDKKEFEAWLDSKNKKKEKIDEILDDIVADIKEELADRWAHHCQNYNFKTFKEYEACGDTYISDGSYITDESDQECREDFEQNLDANEFISWLKLNPSFKDNLNRLVEEWAYSKELDV